MGYPPFDFAIFCALLFAGLRFCILQRFYRPPVLFGSLDIFVRRLRARPQADREDRLRLLQSDWAHKGDGLFLCSQYSIHGRPAQKRAVTVINTYKTYAFSEGRKTQCLCGLRGLALDKKSIVLDKKSIVLGQKIDSPPQPGPVSDRA